MARKSKEPWLRKTSQSMAASRAPSAPAVLNLRMAVPLRAIFFIARYRSTRTPCLKDRRDGLKIQQTYLWVLIPQIHKNGAFRARPWPPSSKCIRQRARSHRYVDQPLVPARRVEAVDHQRLHAQLAHVAQIH